MRRLRADLRQDGFPLGVVAARHRATPSFRDDPVPEEILEEILEIATLAPSGYNLQPWRFIVVRDQAAKKRLREAAYGQAKVEQAPVMIIACGDTEGWKGADMDRMIADGRATGAIKDDATAETIRRNAAAYLSATDIGVWVTRQVMIAFTHLMLAAETHGLDTAPMEGFREEDVRAAFGIPSTVRVVALMGIGYLRPPDKPFGGRFDLPQVVYEDRWGAGWTPLRVPMRKH
jgi:nitroreductase